MKEGVMAFGNAKKSSKRGPGVPFVKGKPPGPGRPRGSRNLLSEEFLSALYADFVTHGAATIVLARERDPVAYLKVVAGLMPTKLEVRTDVVDLSDEELLQIIGMDVSVGRGPRLWPSRSELV